MIFSPNLCSEATLDESTRQDAATIDHPFDPQRVPGQPRVFTGIIGSANIVLKDPVKRDALRDQHNVKAVEMDSSGVADAAWQLSWGFLVVRGICDYCDTHKNDIWQEYAAAVAAGYVRGLIASMPAEGDDGLAPNATSGSPSTGITVNQQGASIQQQIIVQGPYYETHGDGNVLGDNSGSVTVTKATTPPLDPEVQRAIFEIRKNLPLAEQRQTQELLDAVRGWRESDLAVQREMREMLGGLRRAFVHLQMRELPAMDQRLREAIAEVTEVVKADADVSTGLELAIPLIPLLLDYKVNLDLGGGLDLRQWWENLKKKLQGGD